MCSLMRSINRLTGRLIARPCPRTWGLQQTRSVVSIRQTQQSVHSVSRDEFRELAFDSCQPLVMKGQPAPAPIPKWFQLDKLDTSSHDREQIIAATPYFKQFGRTCFVQYELLRDSDGVSERFDAFHSWLKSKDEELASSMEQSAEGLVHVHAPLDLFLQALQFNGSSTGSQNKVTQMYIAQVPLNELPPELQADLPPPDIIKSAGKGDIYNSSIWLGLEPTYTSWHRDPNPNVFSQLHSSKMVRLLPPDAGASIFRAVQAQLGRSGSSRIRGYEMMYGEERDALHEAIWSDSAPADIQEARLDAGDSLFIPKGWWHSIKSIAGDGRLNCSVNWWFR